MTGKVFVTRRVFLKAISRLEGHVQTEMNSTDRVLTPEELAARIDGVNGIMSMVTDRIDPELMDRTPSLKVVANFAVGYNNYEREPDVEEGLLGSDSVLLAPHIASAAHETRLEMCMIVADNLIAALSGERPKNLVNEDAWERRRR